MSLEQIVVLALVQGITEFLPISSSGHLILVPLVTGWNDQGLLLDVAVHVGTLVAVVAYFFRDVTLMLGGAFDWRQPGLLAQPGRRLLALLLVGTLPVVVAGALLSQAGDALRSPVIIAWTTLVFGIALYVADHVGERARKLADLTFSHALLIGLAQMLALIPGTSRSGITMTAGRLLGYERDEAARVSLLLSIPTIFAAGALATAKIIELGELRLGIDALLAAVLAGISAWLAIALMMRWLERASFTPFVVYRLILGVVLLWHVYG